MSEEPILKRCPACKETKPLNSEYWHRLRGGFTSECKLCRRAFHKDYRTKNKDKFCNNPEVRKKDREVYKDYYKQYYTKWRQRRSASDIEFRLKANLKGRIWHALRGGQKSKRTMVLLGCSIEEFKIYLESQFTEGMSWENYGEWHVDHKKPCAAFDLTDPDQQLLCFHHTNMQPLWAFDNLSKGSNFEGKKYEINK